MLALYKSNPSLLQTHEERLQNVKAYNDELSVAEKVFKEKARRCRPLKRLKTQGGTWMKCLQIANESVIT